MRLRNYLNQAGFAYLGEGSTHPQTRVNEPEDDYWLMNKRITLPERCLLHSMAAVRTLHVDQKFSTACQENIDNLMQDWA